MSEREFALRTMKSGVLMYTHAPHPVQASSNHVGFAARAPLGEPDTRFFLGQIVGWFQLNAQSISSWWSDKALFSAVVLGVPTSVLFWYGWRYVVTETGSAWTARFIASSAGLIVFPFLTWIFLDESMLTTKTMTCLFLAVLTLFIQLRY